VAHAPTNGYPHDVVVQGNRAYVADGQAGLTVFDITDPEAPVFLGSITDSLNEAWGVAVADSYVFLAYGNKELMVVDARRPDSLVAVGFLEYPQPAYGLDVAIQDSLVDIAASAQFIVVNVADPVHPNLIFQYYYPHNCRGVALAGRHGYVVCEQLGLASWQLDTFPPLQIGSLNTSGNARGIAVQDSYAYVADGRNGLVVIDVSNPARPALVATVQLSGYANAVAVRDTLAFLGCGTGGIAVVGIADPSNPRLITQLKTPYAMGLYPIGRFLFACDRDMGLVVVKQEE